MTTRPPSPRSKTSRGADAPLPVERSGAGRGKERGWSVILSRPGKATSPSPYLSPLRGERRSKRRARHPRARKRAAAPTPLSPWSEAERGEVRRGAGRLSSAVLARRPAPLRTSPRFAGRGDPSVVSVLLLRYYGKRYYGVLHR